jgi:transposase
MSKQNDLSRCLVTLEQDATLIAVVEMGQSSWLVAGIVPGLDRYPLKKLSPDRCFSFCIAGATKRRSAATR